MLRREVQRRPYKWKLLIALVPQSYRSSVSEAMGFTPHCHVFGREMCQPVDFVTPLPEQPRDVRTHAAKLATNLEWAVKVTRDLSGHGHKRGMNRYNERVFEHA